ncbi:hypothetical protein HMI54_001434 [Coelomomyces lativittatus]|nr:hypothetical protein HMI56_001870 [Coelomomyces lativittatus]KAJ1516435.1 hypothetical protein HMI55_002277 [Coelomomyces lativittatus]KAJ1518307.1 hypothetical protein HMI54_001434 [Coelomomyces lativittatus]
MLPLPFIANKNFQRLSPHLNFRSTPPSYPNVMLSPSSPGTWNNLSSMDHTSKCMGVDQSQGWRNLELLSQISALFKPSAIESSLPMDTEGKNFLVDKLMLLAYAAAGDKNDENQVSSWSCTSPPQVPLKSHPVPKIKSIKLIYRPMMDSGIELDPSHQMLSRSSTESTRLARKRNRNDQATPSQPSVATPNTNGIKKRKTTNVRAKAPKVNLQKKEIQVKEKVQTVERVQGNKAKRRSRC